MIYLDNAATTFPKPQCVAEEMSKCIKKYCGNPGRSSHNLSVKSATKIFEVRLLLAEMFNSDPENIVFTLNTTYALNFAIKTLIKYSSHVIISDIEHNSVYRPITKLKNEMLCEYDIFATKGTTEDIINSIKGLIKNNTSMLICTHVSNLGSRTLPIKEIGQLCKENNITFVVDAAQSAGLLDIDIKEMNINALCFPAHKGLYGPQGVGAIVFNIDNIKRTIIEGGTGINSLEANMPDFLPEMLEPGTLPTPAIAGWCEALKWIKSVDIKKIKMHEDDLYMTAIKSLREVENIKIYEMNKNPGNTILFNLGEIPSSSVSELLNKKGVCTRSGFHCSPLGHKALDTGKNGAVRASFSVFNTRNDIYQLCEELKEISKKNRRKLT